MKPTFEISTSRKSSLKSKEQFMVTRNGLVYFRILSYGPKYEVMTATAGEDSGQLRAHRNQKQIAKAAFMTAVQLTQEVGDYPCVCVDNSGREYIKICLIDNSDDAEVVAQAFFRILDESSNNEPENDLREIYEAISTSDSGEDVYMSDGLWLGKDGRVKDLGR